MSKSYHNTVCDGRGCFEQQRKNECLDCGKTFCNACGVGKICKNCMAFYISIALTPNKGIKIWMEKESSNPNPNAVEDANPSGAV